ncbi:hypothetical protein DRQ36_05810 [bacterium]|nr:MAG: hypothetical protein DRQ36_05810 [bacterium]
MENALNIWELRWFLYLLGYIFLPRISLLFVWYFHGGCLWDHPWVLFVAGWIFMPRMFFGLLVALTTQNYTIGVIMTILGFFMDGGTKYIYERRRRRKHHV